MESRKRDYSNRGKLRLASLILLVFSFVSVVPSYSRVHDSSAAASSRTSDGSAADCSGEEMQTGLMQMLARFTEYMKADFQPCVEPNSVGEECGCFRGENTMGPDERGVRPNADLSMICAFLVKYGAPEAPALELPDGVTWNDLRDMARKSLVFAYSTHKANRLKVCSGGKYWGSTSATDRVWESSLWAMSVAYSAFFQWDSLSDEQRGYVYNLLKAECNYELERDIPTGYKGDTKAEENGWEADVLAATIGLFPDDPLAPQWFERLRLFAINSYSHPHDANDTTVIDPGYDKTTVADLYRGQNLYDDYTLQNHNYFHTSYQNVVIQELGEAALAMKLFQRDLHGHERWKTNALMHNCQEVMDSVLYHLALPDGELAMPNGNDWSLFLYDQITSYSTNACFLGDPHALMLERLAYRQIQARQQTTTDGSWLLRPDVGARRMGVQAHRVMMTWLMHHVQGDCASGTAYAANGHVVPTTWPDFLRQYSRAMVLPSQNIVCAANSHRFTCFSWSEGLKSYTGYIAPTPATVPSPSAASPTGKATVPGALASGNLIVPFRRNNTGNFLGWYDVEGRKTNAVPVVSGIYQLDGTAWLMNGELQTNDGALNHRFAIWSTPGNPVIYIDNVRADEPCTITAEKGGLMAISTDEFTTTRRTLSYPSADVPSAADSLCLDGSSFTVIPGQRDNALPLWANIDNTFGIIAPTATNIAFGERTNNNSIMTSLLYASYSDKRRSVAKGDVVDRRAVVYYSNVTDAQTSWLAGDLQSLAPHLSSEGWNGIVVPDSCGDSNAYYMLLSHFDGTADECRVSGFRNRLGSPVFAAKTVIGPQGSTATFTAGQNNSVANTLHFFIDGSDVEAEQADGDPTTIRIRNLTEGRNTITVTMLADGKTLSRKIKLGKNKVMTVTLPKN